MGNSVYKIYLDGKLLRSGFQVSGESCREKCSFENDRQTYNLGAMLWLCLNKFLAACDFPFWGFLRFLAEGTNLLTSVLGVLIGYKRVSIW